VAGEVKAARGPAGRDRGANWQWQRPESRGRHAFRHLISPQRRLRLRATAFGRCVPPLFLPTLAGLPMPWRLPSSPLYFAVAAPLYASTLLFRVRSAV